MGLYRATIRVQDGEYRYLQYRWIDADSHSHAQEIGETWIEALNTEEGDLREYRLEVVKDKETVVEQTWNVEHGIEEDRAENLLKAIKQQNEVES
jgi:hypothetical protein